jgi:uncharacterized protein YjbI with pentapeptide repeats
MANEEQLALLKARIEGWNKWREEELYVDFDRINLSGADLCGANLSGVNLAYADLSKVDLSKALIDNADLSEANLIEANLTGANLAYANLDNSALYRVKLDEANLLEASLYHTMLDEASLVRAYLGGANLFEASLKDADLSEAILVNANLVAVDFTRAKLIGANLTGANLIGADLTASDLIGALLTNSNLVRANISNAKISKSNVYGVNVWDLEGEFKEQEDLMITPVDDVRITVDNIKVAQFVYLILNNKEIRDVINTLTSKTVLILGRFAIPERKGILDALRDKLREYDLLPIVFDFDRPTDKDFTETIKTLASLSYFVIADVTNPKSSPLELQATVPDYQIPFVPIIQEGESPFAMMVDLQKKYPWVLPTKSYDSIDTLMKALKTGIIDPAVEMRNKLRLIKAQEQTTESLRDYLDKTL